MIDLLDVSAAQGIIDWGRVAAATVAPGVDQRWRGAIVKVTEGESYRDSMRLKNLEGARRVGLRTGAYHFLRPKDELSSAQDGHRLAERIWNAVGDTLPHFRIAIDLEAADPSLTPTQIVDRALWARDGVASLFGRCPHLYSFPYFYDQRIAPAPLPQLVEMASTMPLWWAFYGAGTPWYPTEANARALKLPRGYERVEVWQYSGNTKKVAGKWDGLVPGIAWDVDRNLYLGDEKSFLEDFCGLPPEGASWDDPNAQPIVHASPFGWDGG